MPRREPNNTDRARQLRQEQTPPEGILWSRLKAKRLGGHKFRRQHPIDPFIVDFCCPEAMLVVEVDSIYHAGRQEQDAERDRDLQARGYRVLRITAGDVSSNLDGVLTTIERIVNERIKDTKPSTHA